MTNYNDIIEKTKNVSVKVKFTNQNISNKDYKNNLLNLPNNKKIDIFIKGLDVINKHLNKIVSKLSVSKKEFFKIIDISKNETKNENRILKNQKSNLLSIKKKDKINSKINTNLTIKNLKKKDTKKEIISVSKELFLKNKLIPNSRFSLPLEIINSENSTLAKNFADYKLLLQLNKNNDYESFSNFRNYIKNITKFNSKSAYSFSNNYNYKFNNSTIANNKLTKNLYTFLESSFYSMFCLISKPIFIITPDKVIIHIFYYRFLYYKKLIVKRFYKKYKNVRNNFSIFKNKKNILKLKIISQLLARYFKKPVEFELVKLNSPYYNTNILVKLLGFIINKTKLRIIKTNIFRGAKIIIPNKILNNNDFIIPSFLAGIKVRVAGRLLTQRVIPRRTVKVFKKGKLARGKVIYSETARFTNKNRRGAFSITIFTGHVKY